MSSLRDLILDYRIVVTGLFVKSKGATKGWWCFRCRCKYWNCSRRAREIICTYDILFNRNTDCRSSSVWRESSAPWARKLNVKRYPSTQNVYIYKVLGYLGLVWFRAYTEQSSFSLGSFPQGANRGWGMSAPRHPSLFSLCLHERRMLMMRIIRANTLITMRTIAL